MPASYPSHGLPATPRPRLAWGGKFRILAGVARARGTIFLNTVEFVRERFGSAAHERVIEALPPDRRACWLEALRESSWLPVDELVLYMETAHALLAPDEPDFYRQIGLFGGTRDRETRGFGVMLHDWATASRMATVLWRSYFDSGRLEVLQAGEGGATLRVHDFPVHRSLCLRMIGSFEGQQARNTVRASKTACVLDGDPFCEFRLSWTTRPAGEADGAPPEEE